MPIHKIPASLACWMMALALLPRPAIGSGPIDIETGELPRAIQGVEYGANIRATVDGRCPAGDVGLFLEQGSLPPGLRITKQGLTGTPKQMGLFPFRIGAANNCAAVSREYKLEVTGRPILRAFPEKLNLVLYADRTPETPVILISSTWPGLLYSVSAPACSWLRFQPRVGATPEQGSALTGDRVEVIVLPEALSLGVHQCAILISALDADTFTVPVTVTVAPRP